MTTYYLDSNASGLNDGSSWTDAWEAWSDVTGIIGGDIIKMHKTHRETASTGDIVIGTSLSAVGVILIRVDKDASDAYDNSDATVNFETTSGGDDVIVENCIDMYGVRITAIDQIRLGKDVDGQQRFTDCHFKTGPADVIVIEANVRYMLNCTFDTSSSSNNSTELIQALNGGPVIIHGGQTGTGAQYRDRVFGSTPTIFTTFEVMGFDISSMTRNPTNLMDTDTSSLRFIDCKLPPNYTALVSSDSYRCVELIRCNGTDETDLHRENGSAVNEDTIVRTGGAANSWECTTNSYCGVGNPFYTPWVILIADAAESKDIDAYFTCDTDLNEEEIFIEAFIMDSATTPYGASFSTQERAVLGDTVSSHTTAGSWTSGKTYTKRIRLTQTVGVANSRIRCRVGIEKTSQTNEVYVDPQFEIS